jgi:pimeloyl-ACP methyl ester carboxylesterase
VTATQDVLDRVLKRLDTPATLVGHSMGASIAVLQAAYRPDTVSGLVLLAPPVPHRRGERISPALAAWVALCTWPWLARTLLDIQLRRLGPEELVRRRLQLTCASGDPIDESTRRLLVQLVAADTQGEDHAALVEAARSVGFLVARASAYARAIEAVQAPTLVVHGAEDRILSQVGVRRLKTMQPLWRTEVLDGVGHSPTWMRPAGPPRCWPASSAPARRPRRASRRAPRRAPWCVRLGRMPQAPSPSPPDGGDDP